MFNAKNDIEELNHAALGIRAATVLPKLGTFGAVIIEDAMRQASIFHVLAPCQEWSYTMVEDVRITALIHPDQERAQLIQCLREGL